MDADRSAALTWPASRGPSRRIGGRGGRSARESAPALIDAEFRSVLRGLHRGGALPLRAASRAVELLVAMPLRRAPLPAHLTRAWEPRDNYSAYDALYVALAELLDCPLVTSDARLSRASGAACTVELFT